MRVPLERQWRSRPLHFIGVHGFFSSRPGILLAAAAGIIDCSPRSYIFILRLIIYTNQTLTDWNCISLTVQTFLLRELIKSSANGCLQCARPGHFPAIDEMEQIWLAIGYSLASLYISPPWVPFCIIVRITWRTLYLLVILNCTQFNWYKLP